MPLPRGGDSHNRGRWWGRSIRAQGLDSLAVARTAAVVELGERGRVPTPYPGSRGQHTSARAVTLAVGCSEGCGQGGPVRTAGWVAVCLGEGARSARPGFLGVRAAPRARPGVVWPVGASCAPVTQAGRRRAPGWTLPGGVSLPADRVPPEGGSLSSPHSERGARGKGQGSTPAFWPHGGWGPLISVSRISPPPPPPPVF